MAIRVYLSGSMANRFAAEVKAERAEATQILSKYGLHAVDPAASEGQLWGNHKTAKISAKFKRKVMEVMVWQDLFLIRRCDILLVLTGDKCSDGTWNEISYARSIGIPVVFVSPERLRKNNPIMGWTNILTPRDHFFADVRRAARFIHKRYAKTYEKHKAYFNSAIRAAATSVNRSTRRKKVLDK